MTSYVRLSVVTVIAAWAICLSSVAALAVESPRAIDTQPRREGGADDFRPTSASPSDFLFFEINYVSRPQGAGPFQALNNGDTLRSGDHYKIIFTPNQDCFVYIFQVDAAKMVYSLFPMEQFGGLTLHNVNPAKAGRTYYLPAEGKSFVLDDQTGQEQIYLVAAFAPDPELETAYRQVVEAQQRRDAEEQLRQIDRLLNYALGLHGQSDMLADPDETDAASWQEGGETFSVFRQRLENLCDGCVHVLTFEHK